MRRFVVVLALGLALTGSAGASGPVVTYTITAATPGDNGWYRSPVTVRLGFSAEVISTTCPGVFTFNTSNDALNCTATDGQATIQFQLQFKIDTTAPTVTSAAPDRAPDAGGWYNKPVSVTFTGTDTTSGLAGCTTTTYSGPDSASGSVSGTCRDVAGNVSSQAAFGLRYDTTAPSVSATLARGADHNGWYSKPVGITFTGTDSSSGISACTAPVTYSGPDSGAVSITGGCVDAAGNQATTAAKFEYDSTAPKLADIAVSMVSRTAKLTWKKPADAATVAITRTPGRGGRKSSVVYSGLASSFTDTKLKPGATYRYDVAVEDAAGNTRAVGIQALVPRLYLPAAGAKVGPGDVLAWAPVAGASYYNVQIYRGSKKVLSAWPTRTQLKLRPTWMYNGKRERLARGKYRWYVWPGHGPLKAAKYGSLIGGNTFVV